MDKKILLLDINDTLDGWPNNETDTLLLSKIEEIKWLI